MTNSRYSLDISLPSGHTNGITVLQFSPDGRFLASGSGDGVLLVFSTSTWKPVKQFVDASSINALVWHPVFPKTLISGYASGDVHTTRFESHHLVVNLPALKANSHLTISQDDDGVKIWTDCMDGPVHRIAIDKTGTKIAIGYGGEVVVLDQNTLCKNPRNFSGAKQLIYLDAASWTNTRRLPEPPSLPGLDEQLPTPMASSLHFIDCGNALIVSYSDHGIVYETPVMTRSDSNQQAH